MLDKVLRKLFVGNESGSRRTASLHEAIKSRQAQSARLFAERKPSEVTEVPYLYAQNKTRPYPSATDYSGKWLVFVHVRDVDEVWAKIKEATEEGKLGDRAKVSTAFPNPIAMEASKKVICVYTYDWTDEQDVRRIREELRQLGVRSKIPYKADEDTLSGKYRKTGHIKISKYYE